jgi:hypothetical protein
MAAEPDESEEFVEGTLLAEEPEPCEELPPRPKMVVYPVVLCPIDQGGCGSQNTKVSSTQRPMRRHKCKDCGFAFKSMEKADSTPGR